MDRRGFFGRLLLGGASTALSSHVSNIGSSQPTVALDSSSPHDDAFYAALHHAERSGDLVQGMPNHYQVVRFSGIKSWSAAFRIHTERKYYKERQQMRKSQVQQILDNPALLAKLLLKERGSNIDRFFAD